MAKEEPEDTGETEEERVRAWCFEQFIKLGFSPSIADVLVDAKADWHKAEKLLQKGRGHLWVFEYLKP